MKKTGDKLTVLFNTYPVAFDCPGGGEVQLLKYIEALEGLGVTCLRYDPWNPAPQFDAADIVHFFSVQGGSGPFLLYAKYTRKLPLALSPIIWIDDPAKYGMREIGYMLGRADLLLPNSKAECDQLSSLFDVPLERFSPVVNGVDDIFFESADPGIFRQTFAIDGPFLLCLGNIERRKNQLALIEALAGTGIQLVLAGRDRERDYAAECRKIAGKSVRFIGPLEHGSLLHRSAYAACSAFALPSTLETPGLAALESAACGTPLAITEIGCTREYFGEMATYLDPQDKESIRNAVLKAMAMLRDSALKEHVRANYTWKRASEQLVDAYERLLASRKKA